MKRLFIAILLLFAQPAYAVDHASGFVSSGATLQTGWSQGTGKLIATNVIAKRALKADATILKGHKYHFSITTSSVTQGMLSVVVGAPKSTATTGAIAVTAGSRGLTDIPDNFTTANGLRGPISILTADSSSDPNGAFRFAAPIAKFAQDDPMVFPGLPGASHLHMFICNTGVNAYSTYHSLRTSGGTSCGDPHYPVNRSAYWVPAMFDGHGNAVVPPYVNIYYKSLPGGNAACNPPMPGGVPDLSSGNYVGKCVGIPNGIRYISGFHSDTGLTDPNSARFECHQRNSIDDRDPTANGAYDTIDAVIAAGCPAGSILYVLIEAPICWNGTQVDTANHHDHVIHPTGGTPVAVHWTINGVAQADSMQGPCPSTHPFQIPSFSMQFYYSTYGDPTFVNDGVTSKWHLSSDEQMSPRMANGATLHMDYFEGWSPTVKDRWQTHCNDEHRSCSAGDLGDGSYIFINGGSVPKYSGRTLVSRTRFGWSEPLMGNGTFSGEITAIDSGQFYLYSADGFTGEVTAFSLTDVTPTNNHAPITVHGSH